MTQQGFHASHKLNLGEKRGQTITLTWIYLPLTAKGKYDLDSQAHIQRCMEFPLRLLEQTHSITMHGLFLDLQSGRVEERSVMITL